MKKLFILLIAFSFLANRAVAQVSQEDFDALVGLYNATGGDNWTNNTGWDINAAPADVTNAWHGVTVVGGRVYGLSLSNNNLVGDIPSGFENLTNLVGLDLSHNQISGGGTYIGRITGLVVLNLSHNSFSNCVLCSLGNLSQLSNLDLSHNQMKVVSDISSLTSLNKLKINNNKFLFREFEMLNIDLSSLDEAVYHPQDATYFLYSGDNYFSVSTEYGKNNVYTWFADGIELISTSDGRFDLQPTDSAEFHCEVTNPKAPGLKFVTRKLFYPSGLSKQEYLAMMAIYDSLCPTGRGYLNWRQEKNARKWTDVDLNDNYGSNEGTVKGIYLYDGHSTSGLVGTIAPEIGDLFELVYFSSSGFDKLHGTVPKEFTKLKKLESVSLFDDNFDSLPDLSGSANSAKFYLKKNNLDFADLENSKLPIEKLGSYSSQGDIPCNYMNGSLTVNPGGTGTTFQWFRNDTIIDGATQANYAIVDDLFNVYHCEMKNTKFPDLTLKSSKICLPARVPLEEYNTLVSLYNSTKGKQWANSTNWLSKKPVGEWFGITVKDGHVHAIDLENNNLDSVISIYLSLPKLQSLNLANNSCSFNLGIMKDLKNVKYINISNCSARSASISLKRLEQFICPNNHLSALTGNTYARTVTQVENNNLEFDDIIKYKSLNLESFTYVPQKKVCEPEKHLVRKGQKDSISVKVGGQGNTYQWYKDESALAGATDDTLFIYDFQPEDAGKYYCKINNPKVPDLTLESDTFTLVQSLTATFKINGTESSAWVTLLPDNEKWISNGEAVFENLEPATGIAYKVSSQNRKDTLGTFDLNTEDAVIKITMVPAYLINIIVRDKNGYVEGATVSLEVYGDSITNEQGMVYYQNVEPASAISFTITHDGHETYTGSLDVADDDVKKDVRLIITGVEAINKQNMKLYPNPSPGTFTIGLDKLPSTNTHLEVYGLNGKMVFRQKISNIKNNYSLPSNLQGTYIIKIMDNKQVFYQQKIVISK